MTYSCVFLADKWGSRLFPDAQNCTPAAELASQRTSLFGKLHMLSQLCLPDIDVEALNVPVNQKRYRIAIFVLGENNYGGQLSTTQCKQKLHLQTFKEVGKIWDLTYSIIIIIAKSALKGRANIHTSKTKSSIKNKRISLWGWCVLILFLCAQYCWVKYPSLPSYVIFSR